jgi:hypothetical protein
VSHKISIKVNLRQKTVLLITLFFTALILNTFFVHAADTNFTWHTPAKNTTIKIANPVISTYVKGTNDLVDRTVVMKVNTAIVQPTFEYKGEWVNDYEEGDIYIISDRKEGTIRFDSTKLPDGLNNVEVSMKDWSGNILSDSWSFTVTEPPKFEYISPAAGSEQVSVNQLSVKVSDNSQVDWATVKLKINNSYITNEKININRDTGIVSYSNSFSTGTYTASIEAKDISGNLATKTWGFTVDSTPPIVAKLYDFKPGMMITDGKLKVRAELTDLLDIKDNATLKLDGVPLTMDFRYEGFEDYYGDFIITSKKWASISYEGVVLNGNHTLSLFTEDKLGNKKSYDWDFVVSSAPVISNVSPIKYGVETLKPTISAVVKSPNGSISASSIVLTVNNEPVDFLYDSNTGLLTYTPSVELKNESYQSVNLLITNPGVLPVMKEWKFYTNTYPDMADANISSCLSCHEANSFLGSNGPIEDVHRNKLIFDGNHSYNNCENCHKYITVSAGCSQCHDDPYGDEFAYAPHGSTPTIHYQPKGHNPYFPVRVTNNREMNDCMICHQPGVSVKNNAGQVLNNHDIPEIHKASDETCIKCHAQSLTHEHAREGRTDNDGNMITCNTCHESSVPEVVQAITNKDTSCSACHGEAAHDELHIYEQIDNNCVGCHTNTLTKAHKAVNVTCANCHESQYQVVVDAIANKNKECQTCHTDPIHQNQHMDCSTCHKEPLPTINIPEN